VFGDVRYRHTKAGGELPGSCSWRVAASWPAGLRRLQWGWPTGVWADL